MYFGLEVHTMKRVTLKEFQRAVGKILKENQGLIITVRGVDAYEVKDLKCVLPEVPSPEVHPLSEDHSPEVHTSAEVATLNPVLEKRAIWEDGVSHTFTFEQVRARHGKGAVAVWNRMEVV